MMVWFCVSVFRSWRCSLGGEDDLPGERAENGVASVLGVGRLAHPGHVVPAVCGRVPIRWRFDHLAQRGFDIGLEPRHVGLRVVEGDEAVRLDVEPGVGGRGGRVVVAELAELVGAVERRRIRAGRDGKAVVGRPGIESVASPGGARRVHAGERCDSQQRHEKRSKPIRHDSPAPIWRAQKRQRRQPIVATLCLSRDS